MSWEEQITNEPIEGCTCGTCIWKLMKGGYGKYLQTNCIGGTNAVWMVKYDPDAVQIKPLSDEDMKEFMVRLISFLSIKPNYIETYIPIDLTKDI